MITPEQLTGTQTLGLVADLFDPTIDEKDRRAAGAILHDLLLDAGRLRSARTVSGSEVRWRHVITRTAFTPSDGSDPGEIRDEAAGHESSRSRCLRRAALRCTDYLRNEFPAIHAADDRSEAAKLHDALMIAYHEPSTPQGDAIVVAALQEFNRLFAGDTVYHRTRVHLEARIVFVAREEFIP